MKSRRCHRGIVVAASHVTSTFNALSRTGNVAATGSSGTRNDTPLHCSVNLASFQGIQFSFFFRTKCVIAIRARNTFLAITTTTTAIGTVVVHRPRLYIVRCSSAMSDIRHPFMDHKARLTFSARSYFLAVGTVVTVNEFSGRKVSNKSLTETRVPRHRCVRYVEGAFGDFAATIIL